MFHRASHQRLRLTAPMLAPHCNAQVLVLEEGHEHAGTLYTWRSCSRAVPQPKSNEQSNRKEMYEETMRVLGPEAAKIKVLYQYASKSIDVFVREVRTLSNPERLKSFISQTTKVTLGRMIDMFITLDSLKNFKASLNNDFAFWKRAEGFLNQVSRDILFLYPGFFKALFAISKTIGTWLL